MRAAVRRWWPGPLDVEGLALGAVGEAATAIGDLTAAHGVEVEVATSPELIAGSYAAIEHLRIDGRPAEGWARFSGFFQANDGWVRLHGNYPHHASAISDALEVSSRDELVCAVAGLPAQEVEARIVASRGIATVVRTEQEWATHVHGRATAADPWHTIEPAEPRPTLRAGALPLSGVRVLDLTRVIAGPTCTQLLGCLGADVLRIDPPQRPELLDQYLSNGMGKRSLEADLQQVAHTLHTDLLPSADVVLIGYRPGSLRKYGLDVDTLAGDHPSLVVASLSAWGEHGPWGQRSGFDSIVQAATGIAHVYAGADGRPGALPVQALDHSTGYVLAAGVISLLAAGLGGVVRASLLGAAQTLLAGPRDCDAEEVPLDTPTVEVDSPHGRLTTVSPPIMLDGRMLSRDVQGYGAGNLAWI